MTILQKSAPDLYASDLIGGRYQVIQSSAIRSSFFVYDHEKDDNVRERDGTVMRFESADAGHAFVEGRPSPVAKPAKVKADKPAKEPKVKAEKAPRKARVVTVGVVDVRPRKERAGSMLSVIRSLIREGGSDEEVFAKLKEQHPGATYGIKTVAILRKEMGL